MHRLFADWYRHVNPEPSPEVLETRWACVEAALSDLSTRGVHDLLRVFYWLPGSDGSVATELAELFKEADATLPLKDNRELLRVLAGAALAECIKNDLAMAPQAALGVACVACKGVGPPPPLPEVLEAGLTYLDVEGRRVRHEPVQPKKMTYKFRNTKVPTASEPSITNAGSDFNLVQRNTEGLQTSLADVVAALAGAKRALEHLREDSKAALRQVRELASDSRVHVLEEETQILWWLFGGHSDELKSPVRELGAIEACIALGNELSSLTRLRLPVPAADAFIGRALSNTSDELDAGKHSLAQVVNATPQKWRQSWNDEWKQAVEGTGPVTPVAMALSASAEAPGATDWIGGYKSSSPVEPGSQLLLSEWSRQMYDECLLLALSAVPEGAA